MRARSTGISIASLAFCALVLSCSSEGDSDSDDADRAAQQAVQAAPDAPPPATTQTPPPSSTQQASAPSTPPAPSGPDPRIAQGQNLFNTGFCARCHGQNAVGGGNGPSLVSRTWAHNDGTLEGIAQTIANGVPASAITDAQFTRQMNPSTLAQNEREAIAAYLLSLQ